MLQLFSAEIQDLRTFATLPTHRKELQYQAAEGHERTVSAAAPSLRHPLYPIKSQSILRPLCLQDIKDMRGSSQIKLSINNTSQSKLHLLHLLLDLIEIIDCQFKEVIWLIADEINADSFTTKQQTIILTSPNKPLQSQLIRTYYSIFSSDPFSVQQLATAELIVSAKATTAQQLQHAIYRSLVRLQIRRVVWAQFPIIYKLRQLYGELLQPLCFRNSQYWQAASQLLLSVAADIGIYGAQCEQMLIRIVHLYEYKLFRKQMFMGMMIGALRTTIEYIRKKLNIKGIYDMHKQFKKAVAKGKIRTTQQPQTEFLQHFRIAHRLPSLFPFEESLHQPNQQPFVGVERKLSTKNHQDRRSIQLIEYAMHHKNQFKIRADEFQSLLLSYQHQMQYQQKYDTTKATQFAQIQNEEQLPINSCLTCSPFFVKDHSLVYINSSAIPLKSFQSIDKFKQIQQQFLAITVQFLNKGGGYVMFGVRRELMDQIAVGNIINQAQRKHIAEMIDRAVKTNIQSLTGQPPNIEVDFAPLRENPSQQDCDPQQHYNENSHVQKKHLFLEDSYVTRVRIYPTSSAEIYFLKNKEHPQCFANKEGSTRELTSKQVIRLIRNKVNTFAPSNQQEFMLSLPHNIFDHKCQRFEYSPNQFKKSAQEQLFNPKQINYSEMCMLIARQKDLPMIKRKLLDRGYRCSIQRKFIDKKFASTKHTAVLYIDLQFDRILKEICFSPDFYIKNKPLLTINIQRHVKLQSRNEQNMVTPQFYESIMSWMSNDYRKEVIEVYEYRVGSKRQYFLEMKSKTICLYIYYLLSHLSQRCSFKQPKDLHLLSNEQRKERWIKLFSR